MKKPIWENYNYVQDWEKFIFEPFGWQNLSTKERTDKFNKGPNLFQRVQCGGSPIPMDNAQIKKNRWVFPNNM